MAPCTPSKLGDRLGSVICQLPISISQLLHYRESVAVLGVYLESNWQAKLDSKICLLWNSKTYYPQTHVIGFLARRLTHTVPCGSIFTRKESIRLYCTSLLMNHCNVSDFPKL